MEHCLFKATGIVDLVTRFDCGLFGSRLHSMI